MKHQRWILMYSRWSQALCWSVHVCATTSIKRSHAKRAGNSQLPHSARLPTWWPGAISQHILPRKTVLGIRCGCQKMMEIHGKWCACRCPQDTGRSAVNIWVTCRCALAICFPERNSLITLDYAIHLIASFVRLCAHSWFCVILRVIHIEYEIKSTDIFSATPMRTFFFTACMMITNSEHNPKMSKLKKKKTLLPLHSCVWVPALIHSSRSPCRVSYLFQGQPYSQEDSAIDYWIQFGDDRCQPWLMINDGVAMPGGGSPSISKCSYQSTQH